MGMDASAKLYYGVTIGQHEDEEKYPIPPAFRVKDGEEDDGYVWYKWSEEVDFDDLVVGLGAWIRPDMEWEQGGENKELRAALARKREILEAYPVTEVSGGYEHNSKALAIRESVRSGEWGLTRIELPSGTTAQRGEWDHELREALILIGLDLDEDKYRPGWHLMASWG